MIDVKKIIDYQISTGQVIIAFDPINEEGMEYLIKNATPLIHMLVLQGAFVGSPSLKCFNLGSFNNLTIVQFKNNEIDNQGCKYLSKCSFNSMRKLSLASNLLDDFGVMHLQKAKWRTVLSFSLYNNSIGTLGIKLIGKCQFGQLVSLCISKCDVSMEGLTALMGFNNSLRRLFLSIPRNAFFGQINAFQSAVSDRYPKLEQSNFL